MENKWTNEKQLNLQLSLVPENDYCGISANAFFENLFYDNTILGDFTIHENVTDSIKLYSHTLTNHLKTESCSWGATGTKTIAAKTLSVCHLEAKNEICATDVDQSFIAEWRKSGGNEEPVPAQYEAYLLDQLQKQLGNDLQNLLWNGAAGSTTVAAPLDLCDGLLKQFGVTANGIVSVTGQGTTAGSVANALAAALAAAPASAQTLVNDYVFYVAPGVATAYKLAQSSQGNNTTVGDKELNFLGFRVKVAPYLPTGNIVFMNPSNIHIAVDKLADTSTFGVFNFAPQGERKIRVFAHTRWAATFGIGSQIVWVH